MGGKIDALIYGCTHYPLLREVVEDVMQEEFRPCGGQLQYIDPAKVVAEHIESKVDARRVTNGGESHKLWTCSGLMKNIL